MFSPQISQKTSVLKGTKMTDFVVEMGLRVCMGVFCEAFFKTDPNVTPQHPTPEEINRMNAERDHKNCIYSPSGTQPRSAARTVHSDEGSWWPSNWFKK